MCASETDVAVLVSEQDSHNIASARLRWGSLSTFFWQDIAKDVKSGEKRLRHLEIQSTGVIQNTSPLGAEKLESELEDLKKALEKLKLVCREEEERLLKTLKSESAYHTQARLLEAEVQEFRKTLQALGNNFEPGDVRSDEDLIALWRKYMVSVCLSTDGEQRKLDKY